ncbi:MAG: hypothetical protein M3347_13115 [Armatimonadota bacterium]|nr:hypothetical protein [Armatimonadota bacterium]
MTLTIEITPPLESRLQEEATRRGLPAPEYARRLLEDLLLSAPIADEQEAERLAAIDAAMGALAHTHTSADEFCRRKQEEIDLEEQEYQRRHNGSSE